MKIMGLDPSLRATGVAVIEPQVKRRPARWLMREINTTGPDPLECGVEQVHLLKAIIDDLQPDLCLIENFAFGARGNRVVDLAIVQTCLRLCLRSCGIQWVAVAPTMLKKFVLGKGSGSGTDKKAMLKAVESRWNYVPETHNIADAYGLAMLGLAAKGYPMEDVQTTKMHEAALDVRGLLTKTPR